MAGAGVGVDSVGVDNVGVDEGVDGEEDDESDDDPDDGEDDEPDEGVDVVGVVEGVDSLIGELVLDGAEDLDVVAGVVAADFAAGEFGAEADPGGAPVGLGVVGSVTLVDGK